MNISTDVQTAMEMYYRKTELESDDISKLFGTKSSATIARLKRMAREEMAKNGVMPFSNTAVTVDLAYQAWKLDIADLERRYNKLKKLGLLRPNEAATDSEQ